MNEQEQFELLRKWLGCSDSAGQRLWFTDPRPTKEVGLHFLWRKEALNPRNGYVFSDIRPFWRKLKKDDQTGLVDYALAMIREEWKQNPNALERTTSWKESQGYIGKKLRGKLADLIQEEFRSDLEVAAQKSKASNSEILPDSEQTRSREGAESDSLPLDEQREMREGEPARGEKVIAHAAMAPMVKDTGTPQIKSPARSVDIRADLDVTGLCHQVFDRFAEFLRKRKARSLVPLLLCFAQEITCESLLDMLRRKHRHGRDQAGVFGEDRYYTDIAACAGSMSRGTIDKYKNRLRDRWEEFADQLIGSPSDPLTRALGQLDALMTIDADPYGRQPPKWEQDND